MGKAVSLESKRFISLTLFRYIFFEMLFSFMISFLFFFFIFFVNQILLMAQQILEKHVPLGQVALLVLYSLPTIISQSAPFACLVGTLMTVGRLTSDNEVLVMLSSGLSYKIVFFPAIAIGIIISFLSFLTNDVLLPAGTVQFSRLWRQILVSSPALELEANSVKKFMDTVIVIGDVSGNKIDNVLILDKTKDGERRMIMAGSAELKDSGRDGLSLDLENAFFHSSKQIAWDDYDYARASLIQYRVSVEDMIEDLVNISPREMSSRDVYTVISEKRSELDTRINTRKSRLINNGAVLENILRAGTEGPSWNAKASNITSFRRDFNMLNTIMNDRALFIHLIEFYRKFAVPFGAFFFVFLAVSLGLMAKKSGQTVGFIIGILISVIYWSLLFIGQNMGLRVGTPPFWSMWLPNILCLVIGVVLALIKVRR
ncbi:MAG: LptF/LptG family permease [Treponema sp.]|jgi:lipopolysaccharide export system permease protein|nr:LptF/LptG family permease [Treponema sp.]